MEEILNSTEEKMMLTIESLENKFTMLEQVELILIC